VPLVLVRSLRRGAALASSGQGLLEVLVSGGDRLGAHCFDVGVVVGVAAGPSFRLGDDHPDGPD
jgi:hypothetical protein